MNNNWSLPFRGCVLLVRSSFGWFCGRLGRWVACSLQLFCHAFVGRLASSIRDTEGWYSQRERPGRVSLWMPSFCIELVVRWPTNAWQKSWREQATQRPSQSQNQPNEERMRITHPRKRQRLVAIHCTTATIRPHHASQIIVMRRSKTFEMSVA